MNSAVKPPTPPPHPAPAPGPPHPSALPNLHEIECAVHAFAYEFGTERVPAATSALHDALNLGDCTSEEHVAQIAAATERAQAAAAAPRVPAALASAATVIHVATTGSDATGKGTASAPFASLAKAQAAARSAPKPAAVSVGAGKYYLNETLLLGEADSGVSWAAAPGAAVTLSGGVALKPTWKPSAGNPKILVADITEPGLLSEAEESFWAERLERGKPHPPPGPPGPHSWGSPPALWNTLHVDGVRQVRARFPNGNPQDNTGRCFSANQHAGEGCGGFMSAQGGAGSQPKSKTVYQYSSKLDRNSAPTAGGPSSDGKAYGTFKYGIYDPPAGHPVYNKPMPDLGWKNNSLFSFWNDPLSHAGGGVKYGGDINKTYAEAGTGVVHMFHGGLWGGWSYQVAHQDASTQSLLFSHGGYQEARGSGISHNHYCKPRLVLNHVMVTVLSSHPPCAQTWRTCWRSWTRPVRLPSIPPHNAPASLITSPTVQANGCSIRRRRSCTSTRIRQRPGRTSWRLCLPRSFASRGRRG